MRGSQDAMGMALVVISKKEIQNLYRQPPVDRHDPQLNHDATHVIQNFKPRNIPVQRKERDKNGGETEGKAI